MDLKKITSVLSPTQQRYFRMYAGVHVAEGQTSNYLENFEKILSGKKLKSSVDEAFLSGLILRVMRMYADQGPTQNIRHSITDAEFLISKGLYADAWKILMKTEKEAKDLELFGPMLDIINLKAELIQTAGKWKGITTGQILLDEMKLLEVIENSARYRQYSLGLFTKIRSKGKLGVEEQRSYLDEAVKDPLMKHEKEAITFRSKLIRLQLHATHRLLKNDSSGAFIFQQRLVEMMRKHPAQVKWKPFNYIILLNNYVITAIRCEKFREAREGIRLMRGIKNEFKIIPTADLEARIFIFSATLELDLYLKSNRFKDGIRKADSLLKQSKRIEKYFHPSLKLLLSYNSALLHFQSGEYKKAYSLFTTVSQNKNFDVRQDIHAASRLLQALCLFEMNDTDYLPYAVINLKRDAKKQRGPFRSEILLLNALGKAIERDKEGAKKIWEKLAAQLMILKKDSSEAALYENFDLLEWVEKINN